MTTCVSKIENYRIGNLIDNIDDLFKSGVLTSSQAVCLVINLADTDKEHPETAIDNMVFNYIEKFN